QQCQDALARALSYLAKNFHYGWTDFPTNRSGESTSWITAHVIWQVGTLLPSQIAQAGVRELLSQKQATGAWGFSQYVPPDCDSTAHTIMALHAMGVAEQNLLPSLEFVLSHQAQDGGFQTYKDATSLRQYRGAGSETNYDGWLQSHTCVTTVALEVLMNFPGIGDNRRLDQVVEFLIKHQAPEGYWESYWWMSKYFTTTRILQQFNR